MNRNSSLSKDLLQGRLLLLAGGFLFFYSVSLTISPAVKARSWEVTYLWSHWIGFTAWAAAFFIAQRLTARHLPNRDPYLLPCAAMLSGLGLLTVWRILPSFGLRQTLWLVITIGILVMGLRLPASLAFLRRYKYVWLTSGLLLMALTLVFGTNPLGNGPRLWLGCCGIYLQPSEPLKLLLIVYLAAYLADRLTVPNSRQVDFKTSGQLLPLLAPTLVMTGLALALLLVQRDLGTASIFIFLYSAIVYIASGRRRILLAGLLIILLAGLGGYFFIDVVRVRIDAWINPWSDPSGQSFQIVQSLLDISNGGLFGRGPGLGYPSLVPVAHSDFIFAAVSEESGLVGALGILTVLAILAGRGVRIALNAPDMFRRYLSAGLTIGLVAQSILIIGGNLRVLPLTGVTLPFVSYGGSSLLTSFVSLLFLLLISDQEYYRPIRLVTTHTYLQLGAFLLSGLVVAALAAGWWSIYRGPQLLNRTDNPRRAITDQSVLRGSILDRHNQPISKTSGQVGSYTRQIEYPPLSPVIGYTDRVYGQTGLEASLDAILRGEQGYPGLTTFWNNLLYGQPPQGLDIRTSIDLKLQSQADQLLENHSGALVLLNAKSGEILAMATSPTFDANQLQSNWQKLVKDPQSPLLNRATQGLYPPGAVLGPLLLADVSGKNDLPKLPANLSYRLGDTLLTCIAVPDPSSWVADVQNGCPGTTAELAKTLGVTEIQALFEKLNLYQAPELRLPTANGNTPHSISDPSAEALGSEIRISPLQAALAAAALSNQGGRPAPSLVTAINTPQAGWVPLPALDQSKPALPAVSSRSVTTSLGVTGKTYWQSSAVAPNGSGKWVTWYLAGTTPEWQDDPLALALLLEENDPATTQAIGSSVLEAAMIP
ncbi:MAG: FtsW/RodA/SpoVE family cell cycle protein [Anaerolineales bacterium]